MLYLNRTVLPLQIPNNAPATMPNKLNAKETFATSTWAPKKAAINEVVTEEAEEVITDMMIEMIETENAEQTEKETIKAIAEAATTAETTVEMIDAEMTQDETTEDPLHHDEEAMMAEMMIESEQGVQITATMNLKPSVPGGNFQPNIPAYNVKKLNFNRKLIELRMLFSQNAELSGSQHSHRK